MQARKRIALVAITLATCVGCDQQTKSFAEAHLRGHASQSFFADTIRFDYVENEGSFLGLGESLPASWRSALFTYACTAGIAAMLGYVLLAARPGAIQILSLSLICAGGIGNLLDRWINGGHVRDFLNVGIGPVRTGIFNIADAVMMAGCVLAFLTARKSPITSPES
jgi:signal peptidase II